MSCHDIYVLAGQGCHVIQTYPSAVHPPSSNVPPHGPQISRRRGEHPRTRFVYDDEEAVITALLLLE